MLKNTIEITRETLPYEVASRLPQGYRFVTITCVDLGEGYDIIYHFDRDYELLNLRLRLAKGEELPSISHIYFAAVIVENEMKDLFGLSIKGMAIDYEGRFILAEDAPQAPLSRTATPGIGMTVEKKPAAGGQP